MYRNRKYRAGTGALRQSTGTTNTTTTTTSNASTDPTPEPVPSTSSNIQEQNENDPPRSRTPSNNPSLDSPGEVPASQMLPPSRYTSQRSIRMRSQMLESTQRTPGSYFDAVIGRSGVNLNDTGISYTIYCDHSKFVSRLRKELKTHSKYPQNIQSFLGGLQDTMRSEAQLTRLLSGCIISLPNSDLSKPSQESLMKDFLMIDFLQADIIEVLLTKIKNLSLDDHPPHMTIELILSQLKFVDHLTNGDLVCEKIFELLEVASDNARQTIMRSLEDVIDLMRHNDVVKKLMEILPNDAVLLTEATIDSFGNMCLSSQMHSEICQKIIQYIKSGAPMELLPTFTRFVLRSNTQQLDTLLTIVDDLRSALKWPTADLPTTKATIFANQKNVFNCISRYLLRSKDLFEVWLKRIQADGRHKPIDLIILLMMMTIKENRSLHIEKIIRRKVKSEIINLKLLEETIRLFPTVLLEYTKILFELLGTFIHDRNVLISNFASGAYRHVFGIENSDRRMLLSRLIGLVCEKRTQVVSSSVDNALNSPTLGTSGTTDMTTHALMILMEINQKYPIEMKNNGLQLMGILDYVEDLTLSQFRLIMDILCSMAYSEPPNLMVKDHLDMMVKKQVSSSIKRLKNRGIIGVIRVVDHMVWTEDTENAANESQSSDLDRSYNAIDDLPTAFLKVAANYIDLLITSSLNCPVHLSLSFDEVAAMFLARNRHVSESSATMPKLTITRPFLNWLCDLITLDFQENFIVDEISSTEAGLRLECAYGLNNLSDAGTETEGEQPIAINIAGAVLKPPASSKSSITILAPIFKLTRVLHAERSSGSLETINAILGASVILPDILSTDVDIFDELDDKRAKQVLDIYYHLVNFWRECISAYVSQLETKTRKNVLTRLTQVIKIEAKIRDILQTAPDDYHPPISNFSSTQIYGRPKAKRPAAGGKKASKPKKSAADLATTTEQIGETEDVTMSEMPETQYRSTQRKMEYKTYYDFSYGPLENYRQMDPNIMILFEEELILKFPLPEDKIGHKLGLLEFKFLIEDLVLKIESLFGVRKFSQEVRQCIQRPCHFIYDITQILPKIMSYFNQLAQQLNSVIGRNDDDGEENNPNMFTEETNYVKICFALCLRLLAVLYTWPGFDEDANRDLLKGSLHAIIVQNDFENDQSSIPEVAIVGIKTIIDNSDVILDIRSAVYMLHLVQSLIKYADDDNAYETYVVKLCEKFLSRVWYAFDGSEERGAEYNASLNDLLKGYFKGCKFTLISSTAQWILAECRELSGKNDNLQTFPCFKKPNFSLLFRALYAALIDVLHMKLDETRISTSQLKVWETCWKIVNHLLEIVKKVELSRVYSSFMKYTHTFLKIFLQRGMPTMDSCLRLNPERVVELLKTLQVSTRYLHSICCYVKDIKNSAIIVQIPGLRETHTTVVFKVKALLAGHKLSTAFWMGNLRNKDVHGDCVLSQGSSLTRSDDDEEDELPSDDDDDEDDRIEEVTSESSKRRRLAQNRGRNTTAAEMSDSEDTANSSRSRCF